MCQMHCLCTVLKADCHVFHYMHEYIMNILNVQYMVNNYVCTGLYAKVLCETSCLPTFKYVDYFLLQKKCEQNNII